jgi:hypothetical protein
MLVLAPLVALWPGAAGASGPNAGAAFVALWLLGLQLLVRVRSSYACAGAAGACLVLMLMLVLALLVALWLLGLQLVAVHQSLVGPGV